MILPMFRWNIVGANRGDGLREATLHGPKNLAMPSEVFDLFLEAVHMHPCMHMDRQTAVCITTHFGSSLQHDAGRSGGHLFQKFKPKAALDAHVPLDPGQDALGLLHLLQYIYIGGLIPVQFDS